MKFLWLFILFCYLCYIFLHDKDILKARQNKDSNNGKNQKLKSNHLLVSRWWSWIIIIALTFGFFHNSPNNYKNETLHDFVPSKIELGNKKEADAYISYKVSSLKTHKTSITDNWRPAPATITKIQLAKIKKSRTLEPKYLQDNLPSANKKIKGFILINLVIPKALKNDLTIGIDGGAVTFPAKGNPKSVNEINLQGLVKSEQAKMNLLDNNTYQIPGYLNYEEATNGGTINNVKHIIVVPIPENINSIKPFKLRFNAFIKNKQSHLYQFKVNW